MPTIKEKLHFNYDGMWSSEFDLLHINTDSGLYDESLTASRDILETKVKGKDKPHFVGFDNNPLQFDMQVGFETQFNDTTVRKVINWLVQDYYKPLYFEGSEGRIFYCMAVGEPRIVHNGMGGGYITITMRCDSPFVYSPVILSQVYNVPATGALSIEFFNEGYGILYPEFSIKKIGAGAVTFNNITDSNKIFSISDLGDNEDIYINTEKEIIDTDLSKLGVYRYDNLSGDFPLFTEGRNVIEVSGECELQIRYQFKYRF
jgi:phage-related protein